MLGQGDTERVQAEIEAALELVLQDLRSEGAPVPRVEDKRWQGWAPSQSVMLWAADGTGAGVWLDLSLPEPDRMVHLADQVQDWAVEELARLRRPTNWPQCDAHPATHPRAPVVAGGQAVWACPLGEGTPRAIGG
jgi:hypothetical protein